MRPASTVTTPAEVREAAARLIEERGLWQDLPGHPERPEAEMDSCEVCTVEAIAMVSDINSPTATVIRELRQELGVQNLVAWSDTPGRTAEEVCAALRGRRS